MPSPDVSLSAASESQAEKLVEVGLYPTFAAGSERGLVVLAMGLPYWLVPSENHFVLLVESGCEAVVREQLARFERESVGWPPAPIASGGRMRPGDLMLAMVWVLAILAVFRAGQLWPEWTKAGALDSTALFQRGEWWRLGTALFLHVDLGHLVSNAIGGLFIFAAVLSTLGRRLGGALLFLAAIAGNFASAIVNYPSLYVSIGASTAIFAGLGLLTGDALRAAGRSATPRRWQPMFVAAAAGVTMLALYGSGGQRVDIGAHVCGFAAGFGLGLVAPRGRIKSTPAF